MAQYSLYHDYMIDDSDIGCGRVLVSDCDGTHVYMNICEYLSTCDLTLPRQLNSQCVADFLNTLDTQVPGHYLRISADNCLEAVPGPSIAGELCTVKVDSGDVCGYLADKLVGDGDIDITPFGPSDNRKIRISYNGPSGLTDLNDVPGTIYNSCAIDDLSLTGRFLKVNTTTSTIEGECIYKPLAGIYLGGDLTFSPEKNIQKHYFIGNMSRFHGDNNMTMSRPVPSGGSFLGSDLRVLRAPIDGVYRITLKGNVRVNAGVQAFRIYASAGLGGGGGSVDGFIDCKFGSSDNPKQPLVRRYDQPISADTVAYYSVSGDNIIYLPENSSVVLRFAVDTAAGTDLTPTITLFAGGLVGGTYQDELGNFGTMGGLSLTMEFLRSNNFTIPL